jgi:hypothetical protein
MWSEPLAVQQSIGWPISSLSVNPTSTQNSSDTRLNFPSSVNSKRISSFPLGAFRSFPVISETNFATAARVFADNFPIVTGVSVGDSYFLRPAVSSLAAGNSASNDADGSRLPFYQKYFVSLDRGGRTRRDLWQDRRSCSCEPLSEPHCGFKEGLGRR